MMKAMLTCWSKYGLFVSARNSCEGFPALEAAMAGVAGRRRRRGVCACRRSKFRVGAGCPADTVGHKCLYGVRRSGGWRKKR